MTIDTAKLSALLTPKPSDASVQKAEADAAGPSDRDAALSKCAKLVGTDQLQPWGIAEQRAFLAAIGTHSNDDSHKEGKGRAPTQNGHPCTIHNGRMVCLNHASRQQDGSYAFEKAFLDGGR